MAWSRIAQKDGDGEDAGEGQGGVGGRGLPSSVTMQLLSEAGESRPGGGVSGGVAIEDGG